MSRFTNKPHHRPLVIARGSAPKQSIQIDRHAVARDDRGIDRHAVARDDRGIDRHAVARDDGHIVIAMTLGILLLSTIYYLRSVSPILADNLSSSSFRIQMGTINIGGGSRSGGGYNLTDTIGQTAQGQFDSVGYRVRAGFQYIYSIIAFSFRVDKINVNFGNILPTTFNTDTNVLTVHAGGAFGYSVKAIENQLLTRSGDTTTIPNTSCEPGLPCSISDATPWTSTSTYGFGYNMSGDDVNTADFVDSTYFRPFPANSLAQDPVAIMSRSGISRESIATVTYRLNVSPTQAAGVYRNIIQYIALPSF